MYEVLVCNFIVVWLASPFLFNLKTLPRAPRAAAFGGRIFAAPGEPEAVLASSFFPEEEAGVDLADEGLKGSFLLPSPFSLGDLLPLLLAAVPLLPLEESSSSTTKSASLRSPSLSVSFFIFLASGERGRVLLLGSEVAGDMELLFCKIISSKLVLEHHRIYTKILQMSENFREEAIESLVNIMEHGSRGPFDLSV